LATLIFQPCTVTAIANFGPRLLSLPVASVPPAENIPENEIDKEDDLNVEKKEKASESPELETHLERKKEAAAVM
jgi:hypothetical protein